MLFVMWFGAAVLSSIAMATTYVALWMSAHYPAPGFADGCAACDREAWEADHAGA